MYAFNKLVHSPEAFFYCLANKGLIFPSLKGSLTDILWSGRPFSELEVLRVMLIPMLLEPSECTCECCICLCSVSIWVLKCVGFGWGTYMFIIKDWMWLWRVIWFHSSSNQAISLIILTDKGLINLLWNLQQFLEFLFLKNCFWKWKPIYHSASILTSLVLLGERWTHTVWIGSFKMWVCF